MTTTEVKADAEVAKADKKAKGGDPAEDLIGQLVAQAREQGLELAGEGGLLQQLTKRVLESALEGEITDHLGYDKHEVVAKTSANSRNGHRPKTVTTEVGPVEIEVPPGPGGHLRTADRPQAAAPAERGGGDGAVAERRGPHPVGAEYRVTGSDLGFCCARWLGSGRIAGWLCGCCT
jgi:hypothetical protein